MFRPRTALAVVLAAALAACGSAEPDRGSADPSGAGDGQPAAARSGEDSGGDADDRVARAVLAAPAPLRADATVRGRDGDDGLTTLRSGDGPLVCLADDPRDDRFKVSCYHRSLEAFMTRGRELRARGVTGSEVDSVRFREIESGDLSMPDHPAALYTLAGPRPPSGGADADLAEDAQRLFVLYVPGANAGTIGLPAGPVEGYPWLMSAGSPKAHVMFTP